MSERLDLEGIRKRAEAATPGPWAWQSVGEKCYSYCLGVVMSEDGNYVNGEVRPDTPGDPEVVEFIAESDSQSGGRDLDFIAHARSDIPLLIAEVENLRGENERIMKRLLGASQCIDIHATFDEPLP